MGTKQSSLTAQYVVMTLMFTIVLAMFGAVVQIFKLISSCGVIAERFMANNKGNTKK